MIVVTLEVYPPSVAKPPYRIGTLKISNISGMSDPADYDCVLENREDGRVTERAAFKVRHRRSDGAWALVRRALVELDERGGA